MSGDAVTRRAQWLPLLAALLPMAAWASPYVGLEAGANWVGEESSFLVQKGTGARSNATLNWKTGILGGLAVGYADAFGGFRPELEFDWRSNLTDSSHSGTTRLLAGRVSATTFGANLWYDLHSPVAPTSRWHPYFGGGVLGAHEGYHGFGTTSTSNRILLGYQGGGGLGFEITPALSASVDYRYLLVNRGNYQLDSVGATTDAAFRYRSQSVMLGIRYSFLRTPPPEMPTPPADPTQVVPVAPDPNGTDTPPAPSGAGDSGAPPPQ